MTSKFKLALLAAVASVVVAAPASARPGREDDGTEVRGRGGDDVVAERRGRGADDINDAPDDSDGRTGGGHGADDVNDAPDDSDGRVDAARRGREPTTPTTRPTTATAAPAVVTVPTT